MSVSVLLPAAGALALVIFGIGFVAGIAYALRELELERGKR